MLEKKNGSGGMKGISYLLFRKLVCYVAYESIDFV